MKTNQKFTVKDVILSECNFEPIVCRFCKSNEVTFNQLVADAYCANCGQWQLGVYYYKS